MKLLLVICCLTVGSLADIVLNVKQLVDSRDCGRSIACKNDGDNSAEILPTAEKEDGESDEITTINDDDDDSTEIPPTTEKEDGETDEATTTNDDDDDSTEIPPTTEKEDGESFETTTTAAATTSTTTTAIPGPCGSEFYLAAEMKCFHFTDGKDQWSNGATMCGESSDFFVPSTAFDPNALKEMFANAPSGEYFVGRFQDAVSNNFYDWPTSLTGEPYCVVYTLSSGNVEEQQSDCSGPNAFLCSRLLPA